LNREGITPPWIPSNYMSTKPALRGKNLGGTVADSLTS
jgi:hypothetical protein